MQMDEGTQQNAAMVEEATAAAASMNDQAKKLSDLVAFFKLGEHVQSGGSSSSNYASRAPSARPAAKPAVKAASRAALDRRGAQRPWSKSGGSMGEASESVDSVDAIVPPMQSRKASGGDDDWENF